MNAVVDEKNTILFKGTRRECVQYMLSHDNWYSLMSITIEGFLIPDEEWVSSD